MSGGLFTQSGRSLFRSPWLRIPVALTTVIVLSGGAYVWWLDDSSTSRPGDFQPIVPGEGGGADSTSDEISSPESRDAEYRKLIVGRWIGHRSGKRDLTIAADGTAKMHVTIEDWKWRLIASEMEFDIQWEVKDGVLLFRTTGGRPESAVKAVTKVFGDSREQEILRVTEDELILKDDEGGEDHIYRRFDEAAMPSETGDS